MARKKKFRPGDRITLRYSGSSVVRNGKFVRYNNADPRLGYVWIDGAAKQNSYGSFDHVEPCSKEADYDLSPID